jgi:5'-3' exonuclease
MGIERFFRSIEENNITNLKSSFTKTLQKRLKTKHIYVDFNSIVYINSFKVVSDINYILYHIITDNRDDKYNRLVKEYNLEIQSHIGPNEFHNMVIDKMDQLILNKVMEYLHNMMINYVDSDVLEFIFIAVDGVPTKSKIIEQKKRRYMGTLISKIDDLLFEKYGDDVKKNQKRWEYEQHKINWDRAKITPGTEFMNLLNCELTGVDFEKKIKETCSKLEKLIISGPYEPGEGEKKIVDHLRSTAQNKSSYVIYSPDSDVTLLGLLLNSQFSGDDERRVTTLRLLRHNQQKDNYDVVDIDLLANNLFSYVNKNVKHTENPVRDRIIKDIVFLLTIFGNDFVPKIDAFNVKYDFDRIIDKYIEALKENMDRSRSFSYNYLIDYNRTKERSVIDFTFLVHILKHLQLDEGGNLQKQYISQNYQNYDKLKRLLEADQTNFTQVLNEFLNNLRSLNEDIKKKTPIDKIMEKYLTSNYEQFIHILSKLTQLKTHINNRNEPDVFLAAYVNEYHKYGIPTINVTFKSYRRSLKDHFHQERLENSVKRVDKNWPVTKYDKESYLFQNMLEEYTDRLNAGPINLGYVWIDPTTYTWKTEKIVEGVERYYEEFFGITDISIENEEMEKVLDTYLEGLVWVFEFYFNKLDANENKKWADRWFYRWSKAPLLTQLYRYMKKKSTEDPEYLEGVATNLKEYLIERDLYFNTLEHFMYVTPARAYKTLVPIEYQKFILNKEYYPDIMKFAEKILNGDNKIISCKGSIFLNKCDMEIQAWSNEKDQKFLSDIRKIKLSPKTKERTGTSRSSYEKDVTYRS